MKTRAVVLYKPNTPFVVEEIELEEPRRGESVANNL